MRRANRLLLVGAVALLPAPGDCQSAEPWLVDITAASGIDFVHVRALEPRLWFPEIMSGGACWIDYDDDGDLDLFLVQGGSLDGGEVVAGAPRDELYRNESNGAFVRVTETAGLGSARYGMGCAVGDVDGDGRSDLYVTHVGPNRLYRNAGNGRFIEVVAGVEDEGWGSSAAFLDYDGDGAEDLFLVNYVDWSPRREVECYSGGFRDYCHPDRYSPAADHLFRNRGDGTFEDVTRRAGIDRTFGNGLGVTVADLDADGRPDVYVANDGLPNQLWRNRGDGTFEDISLLSGVAVDRTGAAEAGMGVEAFDADGDLDLDLFLTHLRDESNTLYLDQAGGLYMDQTATSGLGATSLGMTGFGTGFADLDADGHADLFVANGRVGLGSAALTGDPYAEPDHLYRGLAGGRFELLSEGAIETGPPLASRAAAFADYDGDGAVDVVVVANGGPARLLRNVAAPAGAWMMVDARNAVGGPRVGTSLMASWNGVKRRRDVQPAYSYLASNDPRVHFGLRDASAIDALEILTPSGRQLRLRQIPTRRLYVIPVAD